MPAPSPCRCRQVTLPQLAYVLFGLVFLSPPTLQAQEPKLDPQDPAAALQLKARELGKAGKLVEAEQTCLAALQEYEKRATQHPDDLPNRLEWCRCRNRLAVLLVGMQSFARARSVLAATSVTLQDLGARHPKEPDLRLELAKTHRELGHCHRTADLAADATACQTEAIKILRQLVSEFPDRLEYRGQLVDALGEHASDLIALARYQESETTFQEALRLARQLVADTPKDLENIDLLAANCSAYALLVRESGRYTETIELLREAIRLVKDFETTYPDKPDHWKMLPMLYRNLAQPLGYLHNHAEQAAVLREAQRLEDKLAKLPDTARNPSADQEKLLSSLMSKDFRRLADQQVEADRFHREAQERVKDHPDVPTFRANLISAKLFVALRLVNTGSAREAEGVYRETLQLAEKMVSDAPAVPKYRCSLAEVHLLTGIGSMVAGNRDEADKQIRECFAILGKLADEYPRVPRFRSLQSEAMARAEMLKMAAGDLPGANELLKTALTVLKRLADDFPTCPDYRRQHAQTHITLGQQLNRVRAYDEAEAALREAIRLWTKTAADFPQNREFRMALGTASLHLGFFLTERERAREAEEAYAETIRVHQRLAADFPREPEYQVALAADCFTRAQLLARQQRLPDAVEGYGQTVAYLEAALRINPYQRDWLWRLQNTLQQRSTLLLSLQRSAEYERDVQRAREIGDRLLPPLVRLSRIRQWLGERKFALAVAEADDVAAGDDLSAGQWHELAGFYAQLAEATEDSGARESAATHAVEALRKAIGAGYASAVPFAADPQFRSLAARADFKGLPALPGSLATPR